ncbi:hypothetical protein X943_002998 [Babesia divergens]|uniref:RanBP2-type domain-containing protein n=1 Tax=Babesia divergens TaxID=32595 RepID=A0AAD9G7L3_BABDI|nr:hypothetical protein X943_002998 [Babesia divergens]
MYKCVSQSPSKKHRNISSEARRKSDGDKVGQSHSKRRCRSHRRYLSSRSASYVTDSSARSRSSSIPSSRRAYRSRSPERRRRRSRDISYDKYDSRKRINPERSSRKDKDHKYSSHRERNDRGNYRYGKRQHSPRSTDDRTIEHAYLVDDKKIQERIKRLESTSRDEPTQQVTDTNTLLFGTLGEGTDINLGMLNNEFSQLNYSKAYGIDITNFAVVQSDILKVDIPRENKPLSSYERRQRYKEEIRKHPDRFWKCKRCSYMNYLSNYECTGCQQLRNANY